MIKMLCGLRWLEGMTGEEKKNNWSVTNGRCLFDYVLVMHRPEIECVIRYISGIYIT